MNEHTPPTGPDPLLPGERPIHRRSRPLGSTPAQRRRRNIAWLVVLVLVATVLAGLWLLRDPLGDRISHGTERARLLEQAARALEAGELSRADGRGAREYYLAVLAQDPDHQQARQGVLETGRAALLQARDALAAGDGERAERMLALARELEVGESEVARVEADARRQSIPEDALAALLQQASDARQGRAAHEALPDLLPLYERALGLSPDNALVAAERRRLLGEVLAEAGRDVRAGELDAAATKIEQVRAVDPSHADLPGMQARLTEARQRVRGRPVAVQPPQDTGATPGPAAVRDPPPAAATTLSEADLVSMLAGLRDALGRQALLDPPGESAWDRLRVLRAGAPDDPRVATAEREFRDASMDCFEQHVATPRLSAAESCLQALETLDPGDPRVPEAGRRLAARWIGVAEERLGAAELTAATRAYEAALARDPTHPRLAALAARLEQARGR